MVRARWNASEICVEAVKALFETLDIEPRGANLTPTRRRLHSLKGAWGRGTQNPSFINPWHLQPEWPLDQRVSNRQLDSQSGHKGIAFFSFLLFSLGNQT